MVKERALSHTARQWVSWDSQLRSPSEILTTLWLSYGSRVCPPSHSHRLESLNHQALLHHLPPTAPSLRPSVGGLGDRE